MKLSLKSTRNRIHCLPNNIEMPSKSEFISNDTDVHVVSDVFRHTPEEYGALHSGMQLDLPKMRSEIKQSEFVLEETKRKYDEERMKHIDRIFAYSHISTLIAHTCHLHWIN